MKNIFLALMFLLVMASCSVQATIGTKSKAASVSTPGPQIASDHILVPTEFKYVKSMGNGYYMYHGKEGYFIVWKDSSFAGSDHIVYIGKVE